MIKNQEIILTPQKLSKLLVERYPDLSPTELRICALLSSNISSRAISVLTNRSIRTIEYTRNNIRKKMQLPPKVKLVNHLILLVDENNKTH